MRRPAPSHIGYPTFLDHMAVVQLARTEFHLNPNAWPLGFREWLRRHPFTWSQFVDFADCARKWERIRPTMAAVLDALRKAGIEIDNNHGPNLARLYNVIREIDFFEAREGDHLPVKPALHEE